MKKSIAETVREIAEPLAESFGYSVWDVTYAKEGADMVLTITIDTDAEGGITIDDCEKMHRAIDPLLDEADPIEEAYMLSVSSPGIERELTRDEHFEIMAGSEVQLKLFAAIDGSKSFRGTLIGLENDCIVIEIGENNERKSFPKKSVSKCETVFDW